MTIYLEPTVNLFIRNGRRREIDEIISNSEVKRTEEGISYLKVKEVE